MAPVLTNLAPNLCFTFFITSGPDLEDALSGHSMVPLELGQAIIGGETDTRTNKIYHLECSQETCYLSKLEAELSIARESFVAIPIPDFLSGCISEGKTLRLQQHYESRKEVSGNTL